MTQDPTNVPEYLRPYPTVLMLTVNAHLDDALEFLRLSTIAGVRMDFERERLFATSSMVHAFQATEDFLGVVRALYIIGHKNVSPTDSHQMYDFLGQKLDEVPIDRRWQLYASHMIGVELNLGVAPLQQYKLFLQFRNAYLHAKTVWLDEEVRNDDASHGSAIGPFPKDPSLIRSGHATIAMKIASDVLQKGIEVFSAYVPKELHSGGKLTVFKKTTDGNFLKEPFSEAMRKAVTPNLSDELKVAVDRSVLERLGANIGHAVPLTARQIVLALHLDGKGYGYYGIRGYHDAL